ncbi:MAG: circularly permuted type 2 ATP-grasp protein, partial [bacterium]|nr:circularly permuted type 2 ATP-grasp protein [bacterium]
MNFEQYQTENFFDELFLKDGTPRPSSQPLIERISRLPDGEVLKRQKAAEAALFQTGVTFAVYGDKQGTEKIFPFDIIPRIIPAEEWTELEKGLKQRIYALNLFLQDIYGPQKILKDKIIPEDLILSGKSFRKECIGLKPPKGIWIHMTGVDLVRDEKGTFHVLEDNLRCPSGVSYVLENRKVLKKTWPKVFETLPIRGIDDFPDRLLDVLNYISPEAAGHPSAAVLTPGIFNSAYFEH